MKKLSYKDISKAAGVSISTISRYYNKGYVSKNTKKKIEEAVKAYDYYPNHGARLIRGRDNSIFIIVPEWYENAYTAIMNGIEEEAKKHKKRVFITHSEDNAEYYIETIKYVLAWKPSAIVFFLPKENTKKVIDFIDEHLDDTVGLIYGSDAQNVSSVDIDYEEAFYNVTKKLFEHIDEGEKIVYAEDEKLSLEQRKSRVSGFIKACEELKIPYLIQTYNNRSQKDVQKFQTFLRHKNLVNVVSSTHEIFINMISSGDKNVRLTDIGFKSIYDTQKKYTAKIYINYSAIGNEMEEILNVAATTNKKIKRTFKTTIIE
ncbi:LacI family DNA-binding transcriptional regulator [Mycoplasmopsis opalescens]|uniref:LacI family DNA-binding transcriptional regulator n=1 Tax=Mycoplasmopsis opalescens TaxID=114886 RepID=UPI0004A77F47|nr:LacI family DNA-binding transcriptional regulator [Mycoplasmopsis opalescens]